MRKLKKEVKITFLAIVGTVLVTTSFGSIKLYDDYQDLANKYDELQSKYDKLNSRNVALLSDTKTEKKADSIITNTSKEELSVLEKAGLKYDIDPIFLEAIERLETGHYTSDLYFTNNNTWGAFDGVDYLSFESTEESTMTLAETLRLYYFNQGLTTIEEIGQKYCPDDPEWASKVIDLYERLQNGEISNG